MLRFVGEKLYDPHFPLYGKILQKFCCRKDDDAGEGDTSGLRYFCEKVESNDRQEKYIVRPPQPLLSFSLILTNLWIKTMYIFTFL